MGKRYKLEVIKSHVDNARIELERVLSTSKEVKDNDGMNKIISTIEHVKDLALHFKTR